VVCQQFLSRLNQFSSSIFVFITSLKQFSAVFAAVCARKTFHDWSTGWRWWNQNRENDNEISWERQRTREFYESLSTCKRSEIFFSISSLCWSVNFLTTSKQSCLSSLTTVSSAFELFSVSFSTVDHKNRLQLLNFCFYSVFSSTEITRRS
jgi:hypothetical protein